VLPRLRALGALLVLMAAALIGLTAAPASADSCPSPYNFRYSVRSFTVTQSPGSPSPIHGKLTLTIKVTGGPDSNADIPDFCVSISFLNNASPNYQPAQSVTFPIVNGAGTGTFSFTDKHTLSGSDTIRASTESESQGISHSVDVVHQWVAKPAPTKPPTTAPTPKPVVSSAPPVTVVPTPSPTRSPTPSPTASATPASPVPVVTVSPTASPFPAGIPLTGGSIRLDSPSALPGGTAGLSGSNCPAGSTVTYSVEGTPAGSGTAAADGTFASNVQLPDASIGQHLIQVSCAGLSATVPIDLVVSSSTSDPALGATAAAVLLFFLLLGSVLGSRFSPATPRPVVVEESDL
jgi:hypothetical protein